MDYNSWANTKVQEIFSNEELSKIKDSAVEFAKSTKNVGITIDQLKDKFPELYKEAEKAFGDIEGGMQGFVDTINSEAGIINFDEVKSQLKSVFEDLDPRERDTKDRWSNWVEGLSEEDLQIIYDVYLNTDTAKWQLQDWVDTLEGAKTKVEESLTFSSVLSANKDTIDSNNESIKILNDAISELDANGSLSYETLTNLYETFSDFQNGLPITADNIESIRSKIVNATIALFDGVDGAEAYTEAYRKMNIAISESAMDRSFYNISGASDVPGTYISNAIAKSMNETHLKLKNYTKDFSDFEKQIWLEATYGVKGYEEAIKAYESYISSTSFTDWLKNDDFTSYLDDMKSQLDDFEKAANDFANADIKTLQTQYNKVLIPFLQDGEITKQTFIEATAATEAQLNKVLELVGATDQYTESVINQRSRINELYSDATSRISDLKGAYDKLWEYQLQIGEASNDIDSTEFTNFITDLLAKFPELAQYTDGTTNSIEGLREAIARLAGIDANNTISYLESLRDSTDLTEEMRNQIDLLIDSLSNLSTIDMSMDTTKNVISDMCTEMDNLVDLMDLINSKGLKIDVSDAQKYLEIYPEMLANAVPAGDGMIQLNEDVVNSFIEGKKAEIEADGEARIQELQNANAVLESKIAYEQAKIQIAQEALNSVSTMDDAEAVNKINNLQDTLDASLQAGNDELTAYDLATQAMMGDSDALNLLNKTASEEASANWASSFLQSDVNSGKASYAIQKNLEYIINMANGVANAIRNMITGKTTGSPGVRTTSGGGYSGSTGKTSTSSGNTKSGGMLSNILGAISGNLGNFIDSVKGSVKNVVDTTLNNISGVFGKLNANLSNSNSSLQLIDIINTANANIEDYKNAIASNNQQIAMIKAFGAGDIDKYVAKKLADKNADKSGSKGSGGKGGDGGSSANETKETFNWIEVAIERIETAISRLSKAASNTYNQFSARNEALVAQLENVRKEIDLQQQAYVYYLAQAESVGLSESWKNKVKNGEINIDSLSDENLINQIKSYQEWYEKVIQCQDALIELDQTVSDLYKESFDLISSTFDSILSDFENRANLIEGAISQTEERGYLVGKSFYEELTKFENQNIDTLNKKRTDLLNKFSEAVNSGAIRESSEEWYNMKSQIDEVTQSIQEATTKTIEYANAVRDIDWERFNLIQDKISNIVTESNFLIELMSNSDLFDDKGKITNEGISTMGLHGVNYNTYMEQADQYRDEMLRINEDLANDPNNQTLIDRKEELLELQQESITAAEKEKQAIKDLVEQGIDKELDALKKLIDEYEDALDSQKDLYEYQKNIEDQTTEISKLQKQIASLSNDDSEENRAKLQELNESLKEAQEDLEETQYDQFISDQKKLLDELYTEYERILNERLDNLDLLIQQCVEAVNASASIIGTTLTEASNNVGYNITNGIDEVFSPESEFGKSITSAISTYNGNINGVSTTITGIHSLIQSIDAQIKEMIKDADKESQAKVEEIKKQTEESAVKKEPTPSNGTTNNNNSNNTGSSNNSRGDGVPRVGDVVTYTGSYMFSSYGKRPAGNLYSGVQDAVEIYQINSGNGVVNPYRIKYVRGGDLGWVSLSQLKGYKTGVKDLDYDQLAIINEEGNETIVRPDGSILTPLTRGTSVLNNTATENLWNMTNNPSDFIEKYTEKFQPKIPSSLMNNSNSNITNEISMSITLPNVTNYKEFATGLQHDPNFEKMIGCMIDARTMGTSRYKKYTVNFGK